VRWAINISLESFLAKLKKRLLRNILIALLVTFLFVGRHETAEAQETYTPTYKLLSLAKMLDRLSFYSNVFRDGNTTVSLYMENYFYGNNYDDPNKYYGNYGLTAQLRLVDGWFIIRAFAAAQLAEYADPNDKTKFEDSWYVLGGGGVQIQNYFMVNAGYLGTISSTAPQKPQGFIIQTGVPLIGLFSSFNFANNEDLLARSTTEFSFSPLEIRDYVWQHVNVKYLRVLHFPHLGYEMVKADLYQNGATGRLHSIYFQEDSVIGLAYSDKGWDKPCWIVGIPFSFRAGLNESFGSYYTTGLNNIIDMSLNNFSFYMSVPIIEIGQIQDYYSKGMATGYSIKMVARAVFTKNDNPAKKNVGAFLFFSGGYEYNFPRTIWAMRELMNQSVWQFDVGLGNEW